MDSILYVILGIIITVLWNKKGRRPGEEEVSHITDGTSDRFKLGVIKAFIKRFTNR